MGYCRIGVIALLAAVLGACTPLPAINQSRDQLWDRFGNRPVDGVLMTMGTPVRESHLTDGSRLITYQFSSVYDSGSPYEHQSDCEVTFMAQAPGFKVKDIAMQGGSYECSMLAQGGTGIIRHAYIAPPGPYFPPVYRYGR